MAHPRFLPTPRWRAHTWLALLVLGLGPAQVARADDGRGKGPTYLVLPVLRGGSTLGTADESATEVERMLVANGLARITGVDAASALDADGKDPSKVDPGVVDAFLDAADVAERAAATERPDALELARAARKIIDDVLETAGREERVRDAYLRACLAEVRALAPKRGEKGAAVSSKKAAASVAARACQAHVPDRPVTEDDAPPSVRHFFDALQPARPLTVTTESGETCSVLGWGRPIGTTGSRITVLPDETYRIQVECEAGRPSRVHTLAAGTDPVTLEVDVGLESALRTTPRPHLEDPARDDAATRTRALQAAARSGATDAVLLELDGTTLTVRHVGRNGGGSAAPLRGAYRKADLERALSEALSSPPAPVEDVLLEDPAPVDDPATQARSRRRRWVGGSLAGAGAIAAGLAAWQMSEFKQEGVAARTTPATSPRAATGRLEAWREGRRTPLLLTGLGSALGAAGVGLLATEIPAPSRRWVAPLSLAAGLGLAAGGALLVATNAPCSSPPARAELDRCIEREERRTRGSMVLMGAVPVLILPAVHFVSWLARDEEASLELSFSADTLLLTGRY